MRIRTKIGALICAAALAFTSSISVSAVIIPGEDEINQLMLSRSYNVYNSATGSFLRSYSISASSSGNQNGDEIMGVIGSDTRVVDFTKSGVVKLLEDTNGDGIADDYCGTGFVIGNHTIATAGHVARYHNIVSARLFNSNGTVSLTATAVEKHIPQKYISTNSYNYDYALITIHENLHSYRMFNLGVFLDGGVNANTSISVTGFPHALGQNGTNVVNTFTQNTMCTGTGIMTNDISSIVYPGEDETYNPANDPKNWQVAYTADTSGGQSGSPVYVTTSYGGNVYYTVIAIHTHVLHDNAGTKMTSELLAFYKNNSGNLNW